MRYRMGKNAKLYYKVAAHAAWPETDIVPESCVLIAQQKGLTLNASKNEADVTTQECGDFTAYQGGLVDLGVECEYHRLYTGASDTVFDALETAYSAGSALSVLVLDGPADEAGSKGFWAAMEVMDLSFKGELKEAVVYSLKLRPTPDAVPAARVVTAVGA